MIKPFAKSILRAAGYTAIRDTSLSIFSGCEFTHVFDVGANTGQYALQLRKKFGFKREILSYEPMSLPYAKLSKASEHDQHWTAIRLGMGAKPGNAVINVAANSASSSLLNMLPKHEEAAPEATFIGKESISVTTLANEITERTDERASVFVKIDTQGYEIEVLKGMGDAAGRVDAIQLEVSLVPLYENAPLIEDVFAYMRSIGFYPHWISQGFSEGESGQLLQIDAFFFRSKT